MKIAFDMDGVLREGSLGFFKLCTSEQMSKVVNPTELIECLKVETIASMKPLLNPLLFATKTDKVYVITNCYSSNSIKQKSGWLKHLYGNQIEFFATRAGKGKWGKEYCDEVAEAKLRLMLDLGVEVYFDDDPAMIETLRKLTDKIKFIKYGSWVDVYL